MRGCELYWQRGALSVSIAQNKVKVRRFIMIGVAAVMAIRINGTFKCANASFLVFAIGILILIVQGCADKS